MKQDGRNLSVIPFNIVMHHTRSDSFTMPSYHWHNGYEIYLFLEGNIKHSVEQHCVYPKRGCLCAIRPAELHRSEVLDNSPYERISIEIRGQYLDELTRSSPDLKSCFINRPLGINCHVQLCEKDIDTFTELSHRLMDSLKSTEDGQDALTKAVLLELLILTNSCFRNPDHIRSGSAIPAPVLETMQYVNDHLTDNLTLQTVGHAIHYDPGYVSRKFHDITGLPVSKYITYKRILNARKLLLEGTEPKIAAAKSGFHDYSVFYRSFVRLVGQSPSAFLSENRHYI